MQAKRENIGKRVLITYSENGKSEGKAQGTITGMIVGLYYVEQDEDGKTRAYNPCHIVLLS
jgi:hypothetical protein